MYVIYQHLRKTDNEVFYIGIGNNIRPHIKSGRSSFWKNEINKHDYIIKILSDNLEWSEAQQAEIELIKLYGRRDLGLGPLVNLTDGGDGAPGYVPTQEHKDKISKSCKGKNVGNKNGMFGKNQFLYKDSHNAKKVINTETGEVYKTVSAVLKIIKIPKTTFFRWLENSEKNKTVFKYFE